MEDMDDWLLRCWSCRSMLLVWGLGSCCCSAGAMTGAWAADICLSWGPAQVAGIRAAESCWGRGLTWVVGARSADICWNLRACTSGGDQHSWPPQPLRSGSIGSNWNTCFDCRPDPVLRMVVWTVGSAPGWGPTLELGLMTLLWPGPWHYSGGQGQTILPAAGPHWQQQMASTLVIGFGCQRCWCLSAGRMLSAEEFPHSRWLEDNCEETCDRDACSGGVLACLETPGHRTS